MKSYQALHHCEFDFTSVPVVQFDIQNDIINCVVSLGHDLAIFDYDIMFHDMISCFFQFSRVPQLPLQVENAGSCKGNGPHQWVKWAPLPTLGTSLFLVHENLGGTLSTASEHCKQALPSSRDHLHSIRQHI